MFLVQCISKFSSRSISIWNLQKVGFLRGGSSIVRNLMLIIDLQRNILAWVMFIFKSLIGKIVKRGKQDLRKKEKKKRREERKGEREKGEKLEVDLIFMFFYFKRKGK